MFISYLRELCVAILVQGLPEPHGNLLVGILLGLQENMPVSFYQALIKTGTVHVVAASGFNTTIIARVLLDTFSNFLPKKWAVLVAFLGIMTFTAVSGANPAVVRAAIMSIIAYTAIFFGRAYLAGWSLFLTAIAMLVISPELVESLSFWLSVTATGGILWLSPQSNSGVTAYEQSLVKHGFRNHVYPKLENISNKSRVESLVLLIINSLKSDLQTTLAAQIATFPIILVVFGQVSLIAPLVNVLILWLVPPIMLLGAFKLFTGVICVLFGYIWSLLVFLPLELFIRIIYVMERVPLAVISINTDWPIPPVVSILCMYMILFVVVVSIKRGVQRRN